MWRDEERVRAGWAAVAMSLGALFCAGGAIADDIWLAPELDGKATLRVMARDVGGG